MYLKPKTEIVTLPCNLKVDLSKGQCCKVSCPHEKMRNCDTTKPNNPIELCYAYHKEKKQEREGVLTKQGGVI